MYCFESKPDAREAWWVAALVLAAFLLRWIPALIPHFWYDEIYTTAIIQSSPARLLRITSGDAHPPFYYLWTKCFASAGRGLGGPFATLAWLRLASILPGLAACLLAWRTARGRWGRGAAFWTLGFFALSPALAYYSVELRNYSSTHALLLAALIGLLELADPAARRPWRGVFLFAFAATLALYTHSLANLYLAACSAIFAAELALARSGRRALLARGAAAFGLVALCYLPWCPVLLSQTQWLNRQELPWLPWADQWRDLAATLLWYLPLGPFNLPGYGGPWPVTVMALVAVGLALLWANACFARRPSRPGLDRLLLYAAVLAVVPVTEAFLLSHFHRAKVFLGYRYNLIATPFYGLMLLGLLIRIPRPRLRGVLLGAALAGCACGAVKLMCQRTAFNNDIGRMAAYREPGMRHPASRLAWISPMALPWLGRSGPYRLASLEDVLAGRAAAGEGGRYYFFSHQVLGLGSMFVQTPAQVFEALLERRKTPQVKLGGAYWDWRGVWRLEPRELPALATEWAAACRAIEARRAAIPGGQVLLADDPAFQGNGWSGPALDHQMLPQCWTEGPRQSLDWTGPERPGRYRVRMVFWRGSPYPEKEITVRHLLPGERDWTAQKVGLGSIVFMSTVTVIAPRQSMHLELETPYWRPSERLPGSQDRRMLGMIFIALEIRPVSAAGEA